MLGVDTVTKGWGTVLQKHGRKSFDFIGLIHTPVSGSLITWEERSQRLTNLQHLHQHLS